jgi:hypothetical protein
VRVCCVLCGVQVVKLLGLEQRVSDLLAVHRNKELAAVRRLAFSIVGIMSVVWVRSFSQRSVAWGRCGVG